MPEVSQAVPRDQEAIFAFLVARGLVQNAWLAQSVSMALREVAESVPGRTYSVLVCRRRGEIRGVMTVARYAGREEHSERPAYDALLDAADAPAAEALLREVPAGLLGWFFVHQPIPQAVLESQPGVARSCGDRYFTVSVEGFRPVSGDPVVPVTGADQALFEGGERQPQWESLRAEDRVFAILRDGRAVTSVAVGPISPDSLAGPRAVALSALHTETPYRRQGLARRLVGYATEVVLREGNVPVYWTEQENVASQRVAEGLGYWRCGRCFHYLWRRPEGWAARGS